MSSPESPRKTRQGRLIGTAVVAGLAGVALVSRARLGPDQDQPSFYAYTAGAAGVWVLDISDPSRPELAGSETSLAPALDIAVDPSGLAAYVGRDGEWAVVDVRDPKAPLTRDRRPLDGRRATSVLVADSKLFVVTLDPRSQASSILIHTISAPLNPVLVGQLDLGQPVVAIGARSNHLYVSNGSILVAYDIAAPDMPTLKGRLPRKAVGIAVDGDLAYVIETDALAVVDLTEPGQPLELGYVDMGQTGAAAVDALRDAGCQIRCGRAVVGTSPGPTGGGGGIVVVDVSDPAKPLVSGGAGQGLSVVDITSRGSWLLGAMSARGFALYQHLPPNPPGPIGSLGGDVVAVAAGPESEQETPTATRGRETDTPTATATRIQPTRTGTPDEATETATPTTAPTTPAPSRTPPANIVWEVHDADSGPIPLDTVRYVREDRVGRTWIRRARRDGGPDQVVEDRDGWLTLHASLKAAVEARTEDIVAGGSLPEFWSIDGDGNVWVGPEYYDGAFWHTLARDEVQPGGLLIHEQRALLDTDGRAWVPFSAVVECPDPVGCRQAGIRVFNPDALETTVPVDVVPEAAGLGVDNVHLVQAPGGVVVAQDGPGGWVVAQRALISTPGGQAESYPFLEESGGAAQNAGYATSATLRPDGKLQVFTWVEVHDARPDLAWQILANTWDGATWDVWDITGECPLVHDGNEEFVRVTAAAYGPDQTLWVGSSLGEVAVWRAGAWLEHFTPANSPLLDGRPVTDIMATDLGAAWIVQPGQMLTYGAPGELTPLVRVFGPYTEQK